ncbi:MAG: rhodanese-like domain-containing protein, partial [Aggregatilineales bacterium]
ISAADYQNDFTETGHILLDVRTPAEFEDGYIDGAMNINVETLADRLSEIPQDTPIVVYCRSGNRSARAATILNEAGYTPVYDLGGIQDWAAAGYDVVR